MEKGRGKRTDTLQTNNVFTHKEYIERDAAKNAFPRAEADAFENCRYCTCLDGEQIDEILDNIPAADVMPLRHGRWEKKKDAINWSCSLCGNEPFHCHLEHMNFCPNCGARMDGDL